MRKQKKYPARSTLSLSDDLGVRIASVADDLKISLMEATRLAVQHYVSFYEAAAHSAPKSASTPAQKIIGNVLNLNTNPYQDLVAAWRLRRTERQVGQIVASELKLDAWPAEVYLLRVLTELLRELDEHDEFLVVTNLRFWTEFSGSGDTLGTESAAFLAAQQEAIGRGMRLLRLFLLSPEDCNERRETLRPHYEFARCCAEKHPDRVALRFLSCDEIDDAILRIGHFAAIRRRDHQGAGLPAPEGDKGCLVVEPLYCAPGKKIKELRFLFSRGASHEDAVVQHYLDRVLQAAGKAEPLAKLFA